MRRDDVGEEEEDDETEALTKKCERSRRFGDEVSFSGSAARIPYPSGEAKPPLE